jgi:branched-chain amino acid transport system permease protein
MGIVLAFTSPWYLNDHWLVLVNEIGISIIVGLGIYIAISCGIVNLGQAGFMCIGAFASGILCDKAGFSLWMALPLTIVISGLIGALCGLMISRIRGFIATVVTIAIGIIVPQLLGIILLRLDLPAEGVRIPGGISIGGNTLNNEGEYLFLIWIFVLLTTFLTLSLNRSKTGRIFRGTRDNEMVSETLGVNIRRQKTTALLVCSIFAGIGGWLWACYYNSVSIGDFKFTESLLFLGIVVIGGINSVAGVFMGGILVRSITFGVVHHLIPWLEDMFMTGPWYGVLPLSDLSGRFGGIIPLFLGIMFILVFTFSPSGMVGWWDKLKTYYRVWPLPG